VKNYAKSCTASTAFYYEIEEAIRRQVKTPDWAGKIKKL
jgi:hypothetical protein